MTANHTKSDSDSSSEIKLELQFIPPDQLHPHEEILQNALERLKKELLRDGVLFEPVLVSKDSHVILDGHHRWIALKEIGVAKIPCYVVDYFNDQIVVKTWFPVVQKDFHEIYQAFKEQGFELIDLSNEVNIEKQLGELIESRKYGGILFNAEKVYGVNVERDRIHRFLRSTYLNDLRYYPTWKEAISVAKQHNYAALLSFGYSKHEVVECARAGRVFPPKATRHIIPVERPRVKIALEEMY